MRIHPVVYGFLVLTVFLGIIGGFQAAGLWSVSGKISTSGEAVQPVASDVNTIKGWMTLEQVTTVYQVPLPELLAAFKLPASTPATTAIKDLESDLFSVTSLRAWLQTRLDGASAAPGENIPNPAEATPVLPAATSQSAPQTVLPESTEHTPAGKIVTGKTTFQELLDWGVPPEAIQKVIGSEIPAAQLVIKDYITGKGLEFPAVKSALQVEVDKGE